MYISVQRTFGNKETSTLMISQFSKHTYHAYEEWNNALKYILILLMDIHIQYFLSLKITGIKYLK